MSLKLSKSQIEEIQDELKKELHKLVDKYSEGYAVYGVRIDEATNILYVVLTRKSGRGPYIQAQELNQIIFNVIEYLELDIMYDLVKENFSEYKNNHLHVFAYTPYFLNEIKKEQLKQALKYHLQDMDIYIGIEDRITKNGSLQISIATFQEDTSEQGTIRNRMRAAFKKAISDLEFLKSFSLIESAENCDIYDSVVCIDYFLHKK